ncbi:hypothetical protein L209DRAFT_780451 [Thermothelomyces heterothallicus CBS 203.75]
MHTPRFIETATPLHVGSFDPAVSLSEDLPKGVDADILLLGCGDVRNILYTIFVERGLPERKLDFTACDVDEYVIARNVLLLTILLDNEEAVSLRQTWHIYYDLYLEDHDVLLVENQATKLYELSQSLQTWQASPYGTTLRFCDEKTLLLVRDIWAKYAQQARWRDPGADRDRWALFRDRLRDAKTKQSHVRQATRQSVSRSCAPLAMQMANDLVSLTEEHWELGVSGNPRTASQEIPNPVFAVPLTTLSELKYPTNPLLGFHLAVAQADLTELSPLYLAQQDSGSLQDRHRLFEMAFLQFRNWAEAFVEAAPRTIVRFTASECFAFCYTLRYNSKTGETCAHHYRGKHGFDVLRLADSEYGVNGSAPRRFDAVDASTFSRHVSILDLLVSAGPLLKDTASSTLYTACRHHMNNSGNFEELLHGHSTTISLLLGLVPAEYWTNAKAVSTADQVLTAWAGDQEMPETEDAVLWSRTAWRQSKHMVGCPSLPSLHAEVLDLVNLLFGVYSTTLSKIPVSEDIPVLPHEPIAIAALMHSICDRAGVDSAQVWDNFLLRIKNDASTKDTALRLLGALTMHSPTLNYQLSSGFAIAEAESTTLPAFRKWSTIPDTLAITMVVPPELWKRLIRFPAQPGPGRGSPIEMIGRLRFHTPDASPTIDEDSLYHETHFSFGTVEKRGSPDQDDFTISVQEDEAGWNGTLPMVVSYHVPTEYVRASYRAATICFSSLRLAYDRTILGNDTELSGWAHEAPLHDEEHVFITKYQPGKVGRGITEGMLRSIRDSTGSAQDISPPETSLTADFGPSGDIVSITGRLNITSADARQMLSDKIPLRLKQVSPFTIDVIFVPPKRDLLRIPLTFPAPVLQDGSKSRIARKSGYIEITAPLAVPYAHPAILETYLLHATNNPSPQQPPSTVNIPHINLDALPILSLSDKGRIRFMTTLTSLMFSTRERRLREAQASAPSRKAVSSARLDFKESLFTIFMLSSGLQGGETGLFALTRGSEGIHMLLFVSAIRLDGAHGGVVLDAAVLPFTKKLIASGELAEFLILLRTLECCTLTVGEEELALWKRALPALAERCRTWSHDAEAGCEYYEKGRVPVSLADGDQVLCKCGQGKLPETFVSLPEWETAAKYATRVAISPLYASALVEELIEPGLAKEVAEEMTGRKLAVKRCRNCGKAETEEGVKLKKCLRCLEVLYCSAQCQKRDWAKHRMECEESEVYSKE